MDPDYSDGTFQSDGKSRIVCSAGGDIWTYEPNNHSDPNSNMLRITDLSDPNTTYAVVDKLYEPKWSEDGNMIAFVLRWADNSSYPGDGDVYVINNVQNIINKSRQPISSWSDGDLYVIADSTSPEWSPSFSMNNSMVSYDVDYNNYFNNVDFWNNPDNEFLNCDFDAYKENSLGSGSASVIEARGFNEGLIKWAPAGGDVFAYITRTTDGAYHLSTFNDSSIGGFTQKKFKSTEPVYTLHDNSGAFVKIPTEMFSQYAGDLKIVVPTYIPENGNNILPIGEYRSFSINNEYAETESNNISITIPFTRAEIRNIKNINGLALYYRDKNSNTWDKVNSTITVQKNRNGYISANVNKLGTFGVFFDNKYKGTATSITDLEKIRIVPNPLIINDGKSETGSLDNGIIFDSLPDDLKSVNIYDVAGEKVAHWTSAKGDKVMVYKKSPDAPSYISSYYPSLAVDGAVIRWIVKNDQYKNIVSGIYFAVFKDDKGNKNIKKVAIIK